MRDDYDRTALARLLDERAIERLLIDYVALNDAGEWEALAALYVPDGRMSRPTAPDAFIAGAEAILAAFKARPPRTTRHIVANVRVTIAGDGAGDTASVRGSDRASVSSQILLYTAAGQPALVGSYHDRLLRTAAGWRFVERRGSLDFPA